MDNIPPDDLIRNYRAAMPTQAEDEAGALCGLGALPPTHEVYNEEGDIWLPVLIIFARRERLGGGYIVTTLYVHTTTGVVVYLTEEQRVTRLRRCAESEAIWTVL